MVYWCDFCESLVSWSVLGRVKCDGCEATYDEPIAGPDVLRDLVADVGALQFSYAPDQTEAVAAVIAAGSHPGVEAVRLVDGYLGPDSLEKGEWGDFSGLLEVLPDLVAINLCGQFTGLERLPCALKELRLRGSVDRTTVEIIASMKWPNLHTLELGLASGSSFETLVEELDAPSLQRLAVEHAELTPAVWQGLHRLAAGLSSLKLTSGSVTGDPAPHVDELAPKLTHVTELWLPEDCFTAELARLVPQADCSY